jgi:2-dehydro-3-deoxyglucarate aldolase/4-hydroxy-2-oxoheptanedioate aldolase
LGLAHERFAMRREPLLPRLAEQNARTAIILQVEDPRGAAAADQIAAMPGVDMLWLGHNDLSVALDKPGAFDDPDFVKAEQAALAAARKHGKSAGRLAVDAGQAAAFARMGYDFVSIAGDVWLLQQAFAAGVETIRRGS